MNTLEMIVDAEPWVAIKSKTKYEDIQKDERDNNSWWYLHGELEEFVGYDKATTTNCKSAGYSRETVNWSSIRGTKVEEICEDGLTRWEMYANGIIPVKIEGIEKPCVGYFWTANECSIFYKGKKYPHWNQRGLVVFKDDAEANAYALKKYMEKSDFI